MTGGGMRFMAIMLVFLAAGLARAQDVDSEKEIERYRAMINDPMANPGYLAVDRGEQIFAERRGPKAASLEGCDFGQGPGVLEGAYAHLPRYFADADQVMDLEQRLLFCMRTLQGIDLKPILANRFSAPGKPSDLEDLVAFIANKSNGMKLAAPLDHPREQQAFAIGEAMFYRRSAVNDFACATCHGDEGRRIRLQGLVNFSVPNKSAQDAMGSWPTYRVSQSALRTMQHRLWDCYRQMRMPVPVYGSEGLTALTVYLARMGAGAEINVPSIKR